MASEEPAAGVLNYKVYVLKVSIHCEGCKKKIHRILSKIDGVYKVDIDAREKKVTVMASVDGDTLVRKLAKSVKNAELLPPPLEKKAAANGDGSNNSKNETKEPSKPKQQHGNAAQKKPAKKVGGDSAAKAAEKTSAATASAPAAAKPADANITEAAAADPAKTDDETVKKNKEQAKSDAYKIEASNPPPGNAADAAKAEAKTPTPEAFEKTVGNGTAADSGGKAAGSCKKRGKKAQKDGDGEAAAAAATRSADMVPDGHPPMAASPYMYPYPVYVAPQHPAYVMSYNVAQPSVSHSYYAPALPPASQGFVYHPYPPPAEFYYGPAADNGAPLPHPHPYDMFSEENPNACNLM